MRFKTFYLKETTSNSLIVVDIQPSYKKYFGFKVSDFCDHLINSDYSKILYLYIKINNFMRFKTFYLYENNKFFSETTLDFVKDLGYSKSITPRNTLIVYHGTSKKNADNILKTGKFKGHPWFALDRSIAEKYATSHGGKNNIILTLEIDPAPVLPVAGSYLSARMEGLTIHGKDSNNNVWHLPTKDLK